MNGLNSWKGLKTNKAMKKFLLFAALSAMALSLSAQTKNIQKEYSEFSVMEISDAFDVTLVPSDEYSAILTVDEVLESYVRAFVKGKTLYITLDTKSIPKELKKQMNSKNTPEPTLKAVVRAPKLSSVILTDDAVFGIAEPVNYDSFSLTAGDNSKVRSLNIQGRKAELKLDKKASVTAKILADDVVIKASGSSVLNLEQESKDFNVESSGSAAITSVVSAKNVNLTTSGSSVLTLTGTTDNLVVKGSGSSTVNAVNLTTPSTSVVLANSCTVTQSATKDLKVEMSGKSTLIYNNNPKFEIVLVKTSTIQKYK